MAASRLCAVEGCGKPAERRDWCGTHYARFRRLGDPLGQTPRKSDAHCSVKGCGKPYLARGFCIVHYARWKKHGDPNGGGRRGFSEPFYQDVVLHHDSDECLFWPFARGKDGRYAAMRHEGVPILVHRRLCEEVNGPPPTLKHEAAHSCGNGHLACVAKRHLSWKTHVENMADKLVHGTHNRGARNGLVKLTETDVRRIRALKGYISMKVIGTMFGVSQNTVSQIYSGKSWAWLK